MPASTLMLHFPHMRLRAHHRKFTAHRHSRHRVLGVLVALPVLVVAVAVGTVAYQTLGLAKKPIALGATFSTSYARSLGLDWRAAYLATLDGLEVRNLRIPVYWPDVEPKRDTFDFSELDWMLAEAAKRNARVTLAIGRKLPRWPECHVPEWASTLLETTQRVEILSMLENVVQHVADNATVVAWQVENEPFFLFGECPEPNRRFL